MNGLIGFTGPERTSRAVASEDKRDNASWAGSLSQRDSLDLATWSPVSASTIWSASCVCIRRDLPRVSRACWLSESRWPRARGAAAVLAAKTIRISTLIHYGAEDCSLAEHLARSAFLDEVAATGMQFPPKRSRCFVKLSWYRGPPRTKRSSTTAISTEPWNWFAQRSRHNVHDDGPEQRGKQVSSCFSGCGREVANSVRCIGTDKSAVHSECLAMIP